MRMSEAEKTCDSCHLASDSMSSLRRGGVEYMLCDCCMSWVKMSLRRTRRVPKWIRSNAKLEQDGLAQMREEFCRICVVGRGRRRRHLFDMGFKYLGPFDDRSWSLALTAMNLRDHEWNGALPYLHDDEIEQELSKLDEAGVICLPTNPMLRKQVAHLLRGDLGKENKQRLITAIFLWLVPEDEFIGRNPEPWARSFQFLQEIIGELGDKAIISDGSIRIIGTSGNFYRIRPRNHPPHYIVARECEDGRTPNICIDPLNSHTVVFGDILVNLVLALFDDVMSARHIHTLAPHVLGTTEAGLRRPWHGRQRPRNVEHLWRRALGNMPGERIDPGELFQQWRRVIDRFQTNLADWSEEEDEE